MPKVIETEKNDALIEAVEELTEKTHPGAAVALVVVDMDQGLATTAFVRCHCGHMDGALTFGLAKLQDDLAEITGTVKPTVQH